MKSEVNKDEYPIVALLTEIQLPLLMYVRSLMPGDSAASDVAQQANATIWQKRSEFEIGTNFKAWAFSVVRFEVLNYRKKQARDAKLVFSDELELAMEQELASTNTQLDQQHEALQICLRKLRPKDRDLLLHRYASGGTLKDFADQFGRSVNGLKVTLHRLRNTLLECVRRQMSVQEYSS